MLPALSLIQPLVLLAGVQNPPPPKVHAGELQLHEFSGEEGDRSWGLYRVYEDRKGHSGRTIDLYLEVLKARTEHPAPDPVFVLAGGPGQAATTLVEGYRDSWIREKRDIVLVDQRGTGRSNPLRVALPGSEDNLQGYFEPAFSPEAFRAALPALERRADLRLYSTPLAMDDLDEVRAALGYESINLMGGSYGTRAALVFLRRHPKSARTAVLNGVAPMAFRNPLFHAAGAQEALDLWFDQVEGEPAANRAFPRLRQRFGQLLERLEAEPAVVELHHPGDGRLVEVLLDRRAFAEALRVLLYYDGRNAQVPLLIHRACEGDLQPFAEAGLTNVRAIREALAFGMLMCVTNAEDLARIDPKEVPAFSEGTFLGDDRVRTQLAVGAIWPRGVVPASYGEPVSVDVPVLIFSGLYDPVTPPRWGEEAARHLPRSLHVVAPRAHGVHGPEAAALTRAFLEQGTVEGLDPRPVESLPRPKVVLPAKSGD